MSLTSKSPGISPKDLKDLLEGGTVKIVVVDKSGNVISDVALSTIIDDLRGSDNKTLTDLFNKAYDSSNDRTKISIENDTVGLAKEITLSAINTKLSQSLLIDSILSYDNSTGTTTADYTVFASDVAINFNGVIVLQIIMNQATTVQLKLTPAGQTTAQVGYVNSGSPLSADSWYEFELNVNNGDSLNVIIQVPAGATLIGYLRIFKRER